MCYLIPSDLQSGFLDYTTSSRRFELKCQSSERQKLCAERQTRGCGLLNQWQDGMAGMLIISSSRPSLKQAVRELVFAMVLCQPGRVRIMELSLSISKSWQKLTSVIELLAN